MKDFHDAHTAAADEAFPDYDFEPDMVSETGSWDSDDRNDEWMCILSMDGSDGPYVCGFIVRFEPGTAIVVEAYPGDPH